MDDTPFHKRKWFYIIAWLAILLVVYGWQISRMGGVVASEWEILIDLACVFPFFLVFWLVFFSQFVLPVQTFRDRQKIFDRLITYIFGRHGPAMFIRDGQLIKREGEERRKGPGVLWLDSASAAVTRTATAIKQTLGPGVHFIGKNEFIAGIVDLHGQTQGIGPKESDKPFEKQKEGESDDAYREVQDRRKMVSGITRDGIEVIPNISVNFRVDTGFPKEGQTGSRFGYRTGVAKKDKKNEEKDKEAIRRAVLGQGIKPNVQSDSPRHQVAWNQLPGLLAVDVWREYVSKFTLDELFKQDQLVPSPPPQLPQPTEDDIDMLSQPVLITANDGRMRNSLISALRFLNIWMNRMITWLEKKEKRITSTPAASQSSIASQASPNSGPQKKTALQVINDMVKARLTQSDVDILDEHGGRHEARVHSFEYNLLQERGIKVTGVGISNLRVDPEIDKEMTSNWEATWLKNAKYERAQIERRRVILQTAGEEQAVRNYAGFLSRGLMKEKPSGIQGTLKTLLMRTRLLILKTEQLRHLMSTERQDLEEILQWVEDDE